MSLIILFILANVSQSIFKLSYRQYLLFFQSKLPLFLAHPFEQWLVEAHFDVGSYRNKLQGEFCL